MIGKKEYYNESGLTKAGKIACLEYMYEHYQNTYSSQFEFVCDRGMCILFREWMIENAFHIFDSNIDSLMEKHLPELFVLRPWWYKLLNHWGFSPPSYWYSMTLSGIRKRMNVIQTAIKLVKS